MVILFFGSFHGKRVISPPKHNPHTGFLVDIVSIVYHIKNPAGGLCVGGVSIQPGDLHTRLLETISLK